MREVKQNFQKLSSDQRDLIAMSETDIHRQFIYDVRLKESPLLKEPWARGWDESKLWNSDIYVKWLSVDGTEIDIFLNMVVVKLAWTVNFTFVLGPLSGNSLMLRAHNYNGDIMPPVLVAMT